MIGGKITYAAACKGKEGKLILTSKWQTDLVGDPGKVEIIRAKDDIKAKLTTYFQQSLISIYYSLSILILN